MVFISLLIRVEANKKGNDILLLYVLQHLFVIFL